MMLKKVSIMLCLLCLIYNAVYKLPAKVDLIFRAEGTFRSYTFGYKYTTLFNTYIDKSKNFKDIKNSESASIYGIYLITDYPRLIFHSLLIIALFTIMHLLLSLNLHRKIKIHFILKKIWHGIKNLKITRRTNS